MGDGDSEAAAIGYYSAPLVSFQSLFDTKQATRGTMFLFVTSSYAIAITILEFVVIVIAKV